MQQTFAIVKHHAVEFTSEILAEAQNCGLRVVHLRFGMLPIQKIEAIYALHVAEPYWPRLRDSVAGEVAVAILEGHEAVLHWRAVMGATDPAKAVPGTIRYRWGNKAPGMMHENAVHGSDSVESARREIAIVFPEFVDK